MTDVERVPVYNYVSSSQRPITWDTFRKYVRAYGGGTPGVKTLRPQCMFWNGRQWLHRILLWLFHLLPAIVVDAAAVCTGRDARSVIPVFAGIARETGFLVPARTSETSEGRPRARRGLIPKSGRRSLPPAPRRRPSEGSPLARPSRGEGGGAPFSPFAVNT